MNNVMYTVLNADIPLVHIGVRVHIIVKCVTRHSGKRVD
jgi:hypothetical protein